MTIVTRKRGRAGVAARARFLMAHPLCVSCQRDGQITEATQVDHIKPLARGGADADHNKQPLCDECHRIKSARDFMKRAKVAFGVDGEPIGDHHWNRP